MSTFVFFIAAIGAITGAIGVIALKNPYFSVLSLVGHMLSLAALFLLLRAEFLAAAQVIIYAGAVIVLYVFVVSYVGESTAPLGQNPGRLAAALGAFACGGALVVELFIAFLGSGLQAISGDGAPYHAGFGTPGEIGTLLLNRYLAPFEIASFLLLVAAIGAVTLARRRRGLETGVEGRPPALEISDLMRPRPLGTGTMREAGGSVEVDALSISWYLAVSALVFSIGAAGVLVRRNPIVILLCLELMLNAANLALIGFSRMWGNADGQVFALIVVVVAACEVVIGLGLIVAMHRRHVPVDVDEMRELQGMSATSAAWLVLAMPLGGTIAIGALFRRLPGRSAGWLGTATIAASFVFALIALLKLQQATPAHRELTSTLWTIAGIHGFDARATLLVDPLSVLMICVVSGVSMLIHLYSISYLSGDRGYSRFFAYLNFFVFSMLLLVLAGNFVLLIIGWAFVGAASYMLISFWYRRTTATSAGIKAFVINVLGDIGLVLGTFFIFRHTHTLDLVASFHAAPHVFASGGGDVTAGCLLLLVGAFAKSAQIPLHTWLPDAMEGPTPVSALIHAATMVTAGVYLIARMHPLFQLAPAAGDVGAIIGCLTLLVAGTIGLAATDLKRVIAYSTMSQIGYMIMGVSVGAYTAGFFHLMAHAFFKALLFMAAGSLISAMGGSQSLDRMSGFRRALPFTFGAFIIGGLALSGVPPLSGYFSKDSILLFVAGRGGWHWVLWVAGYLGAFLTALYTFRMIFRAFLGDPCPEAAELIEHGHLYHPEAPTNPANGEIEDTDVGFPGPEHAIAERSWPMRAAMGTLALLAIVGGIVAIPKSTFWLDHFLAPTFSDSTLVGNASNAVLVIGLVLGALVSLGGIATAYYVWVLRPGLAPKVAARFRPLSTLFENKWYFDELIDGLIVRPGAWFGRFAQNSFERVFVNGALVGGSTGLVRAGSALVRATQSGMLRVYAALMLVGVVGVALYFLLQS